MKRLVSIVLALAVAALLVVEPARAQVGYNGVGALTRPANTTTYGSGAVTKLVAGNTAGSAVATPVVVVGTNAGANQIVAARLATTGTGASGAAFKVHLFAAGSTPTLASLVDGSGYAGPYAADLAIYVGTLTCSSLVATSDGSAQYWADCSLPTAVVGGLRFSGASTKTTLLAVVEVTTGYVPISGEKLNLWLATIPRDF